MIKNIKNWKIWLMGAGLLTCLYKAAEYGKLKERNRNKKQILDNIKKSKETDETIKNATPSERADLL